jgi:LysM repeat protein
MPRSLLASFLTCATIGLATEPADAQSLRGSPVSVDRMYRQARAENLTFHRTASSARAAAARGELVRLTGNADYRLHEVSHPYALPATRTFVERLAAQYRTACGERLVVTSALRPTSMRLVNASPKSVHPAGMAVDLRKSKNPRCLSWLRNTLLHLERTGVIEATEEHRPPHFHVAVFPTRYGRYVQARTGRAPAASAARASATYRVRQGDSLWSIARRHGTSVERIREANEIRSTRILPGQVLVIPTAR